MPRYQDSGRLRGYAHATFSSQAEATAALDLNNSVMHGRYLTVQPARSKQRQSQGTSRPRPPGCTTLHVKNLPYSLGEQALKQAFASFGSIANVRLARWGHTGRLKGFGYVQFTDGAGAEAAMAAAANITIAGRAVVLDYDGGAPKASFKTPEGRQWAKEHGDLAPSHLKDALHSKAQGAGDAKAEKAPAAAPVAADSQSAKPKKRRGRGRVAAAERRAAAEGDASD